VTDWVPAFIGYRELREWFAKCVQDQTRWSVINFYNIVQLEFVKGFRIADAIAEIEALDSRALKTGEPVFVEGYSLII
jgi:hypothetical protein